MREIKFRAWFEMEKQMVTHDRLSMSYDKGEGFTFAFDDWSRNDDGDEKGTLNFILMQYTGLLDIKGIPIYEKDLLEDDEGFVWKVFYRNGAFYAECADLMATQLLSTVNFFGKVVGNIYEHSHLVEVQE